MDLLARILIFLYVAAMRIYVVIYLSKKKKEECMLSYVKNHGKVMFHSMLGKRVLSDAWAFDTAQKPYVWQRLNPEGDRPSARM